MATLIFTLLGLSTLAASDPQALVACSAIAKGSAETQTSGIDYQTAKDHYWSAANADDTPACVVFPTNAAEVSYIVQVLQEYSDVDFAMKSGGHNPNRGFSSVNGGVLISFSKLASTSYNSDSKTADIGPGSRWGETAIALEPYGVTVVGGRVGDVGVGGLLLGCGLSFFSAQYGLPCDSVINYEVVLSNATIVNANATSNTDLFWALKGGGNQFGIVTKFTMQTYQIGQVWGGVRIYDAETSASALINATHDFIANFNDSRAAVIVTGEITIDTLAAIFVVFYFYNGETPPRSVFDKFNAIPFVTDSTKTQSYSDLVNANSAFSIYGFRYLIRGTTLPNLPYQNGTDLYNYHYNTWKSYVTNGGPLNNLLNLDILNLVNGALQAGYIFSIAFQPMPYAIPAASNETNSRGNVLGLTPQSGDHVWMEYDISWLASCSDESAHNMSMNITTSIDQYARKKYIGVQNTHYESGNLMWEEYNPTFLNDAMYDQKPLQSYGRSTYNRLKSIQMAYDPVGFFPKRTGGFKFT